MLSFLSHINATQNPHTRFKAVANYVNHLQEMVKESSASGYRQQTSALRLKLFTRIISKYRQEITTYSTFNSFVPSGLRGDLMLIYGAVCSE